MKVFAAIALLLATPAWGSDLFQAIDAGDLGQVAQMIEDHPELLNDKNGESMTPLNQAALKGRVEIIRHLLSMGAVPGIGDRENSQPIHIAALGGHIAVIDLLLAHGVDIDSQDDNGMTALLFAISSGQVETALHLLAAGASFEIAARQGRTALHYAASSGQVGLVRRLLDLGAKLDALDYYGRTPVHAAIMGRQVAVAELMMRAGAEPENMESNPFSPITWAIRNGDLPMIDLLTANGADIHRTTPLGETFLHFASFLGNHELVEYFIKGGIDVNATKRGNLTPLHIAAVTGARDIVECLIENGADLNVRSTDGGTPLHFARAARHEAVVDLLLAKGAEELPRAFPVYRGSYLGAPAPGDDPELFVPELFRDIYRVHSCPAFTPDGREVYWEAIFMMGANEVSRVWFMREEDGVWQAPRVAPFADYPCGGPILTHDGESLIYQSWRPRHTDAEPAPDLDLWLVERQGEDWSEPIHLGPAVNSDGVSELDPHLAPDGTLYVRAGHRGYVQYGLVDGRYTELGVVGDFFHTEYVDPCRAMKHIILGSPRRRDRFHPELFISFHLPDGKWSEPVHMGDRLHQGFRAYLGRVSPDGRYLFFVRDYSFYCVNAGLIETLRP